MAIHRLLRVFLLILLVLTLAGPASAQGLSPPVATDHLAPRPEIASAPPVAPVILEGRLVAEESSSGVPGWLLEVERVIQGPVPGSTLLLIGDELAGPRRPETGPGMIHVVALPLPDGSFRILSWRPLSSVDADTPPDPLPPGLAVPPEPPLPQAGGLRNLSAASTATPTFKERVVALVNEERLANGSLPPLKQDPLLTEAAHGHSQNMAERDFFAHCDPDTGTLPADRMFAAGYFGSFAAENIAAGSSSPELVMSLWMGSPGHRANILSTSTREIGVGYFQQSNDQGNVRRDLNSDCIVDSTGNGPFSRYWTQMFSSRFNVFPVVIDREAHSTTSRSVELYLYGEGWAEEMRVRNAGGAWSSWQAFNPNRAWTLPTGAGTKTVEAELRASNGSVLNARDTIFLDLPCEAVASLDLTAQTITGSQTFEACDTITAGADFEVGSTGTVTFKAGNRVVLGDGFSVAGGGSFTVEIGAF